MNAGVVQQSEAELVAGLRARDPEAFSELISRYTEKVHNLAMRITRNKEDTEEVLQDVFLTVHRKIGNFEGKSAFSSWLYRVTANAAFMKLRKRRQAPAVSIEELSGQPESLGSERSDTHDVDFLSTRHELRAALEEAIEKLPEDYRAIFVLRDVDGLSNEEVADAVHLTVPAVKSRLHRARQMLRRKLQRYYDDFTNDDVIDAGPAAYFEMQMAA